MLLFDSHCHLEDDRFSGDRDEVISQMRETGVVCCTCAGSDINTSNEILRLSKEYRGVYAACGVHPWCLALKDYLTQLDSMLKQDKCVALAKSVLIITTIILREFCRRKFLLSSLTCFKGYACNYTCA